jgi:hypothetical protein
MIRVATLNTWGIRGDWKSRLRVFQEGFAERSCIRQNCG